MTKLVLDLGDSLQVHLCLLQRRHHVPVLQNARRQTFQRTIIMALLSLRRPLSFHHYFCLQKRRGDM
jgi:hypothetical protein